MKFYMIQTLQIGHGKKMPRIQSLSMLFGETWPKYIWDNHFPNIKKMKEEMGNVPVLTLQC